MDADKKASYSATTALPTAELDYNCNAGYSFESVATDSKVRTTKKIKCVYSSTPSPGASFDKGEETKCVGTC